MTTITAEATASELLAELRDLVNRYDGAQSLDDVRELLNAVTQRVRKARGRIGRLARQIAKTETPAPPVVEPAPVSPTPVVIEPKPVTEPDRTEPASESAPPAATPGCAPNAGPRPPRPVPRRITALDFVLVVLASWWSTASTHTRRTARRAVHAARTTGRRAGRLAATIRSALGRTGGAP